MIRSVCILATILSAFLVLPAGAQITITTTDAQTYLAPGIYGKQTLTATSGEAPRIQNVLDQIGSGGVYDFKDVGVEASFTESETQTRPFESSVPSDPAFSGANYVDISSVFFGTSTYNFLDVEDATGGPRNGLYEYGDITPSSFFETKTTYTPAQLALPLPLSSGTVWSSGPVTEETFSNGTLMETVEVEQSGEVIGYGTLVLPGGTSLPALVYELVTIEEADSANATPDTTRSISFITKSRAGFVTVLVDENRNVLEFDTGIGSSAPAAFLTTESDAAAFATFSAGETGQFLGGDLGATVEITTGSAAGSTLRGYRINFGSFNTNIDDTGSPAGFPVTNVSGDVYWVITAGGFDGTYEVCLDYSGVPGISDESQLAILKRSSSIDPWATVASNVDQGSQLVCAAGLNDFSEFTIGGGSSNPLPVELAQFEAMQVDGGVALAWQTASETDNAGFQIQRAGSDGAFRRIAFVEGAGTTADAREYRFVDRTLPFSATVLKYRLRQMDLDGTAHLSDDVLVRIASPTQMSLHEPYPNPVRSQATLRYALAEAADVEISVYNVLGQRLSVLVDGRQPAGRSEQTVDTSDLPSGLYFVRMVADGQVVNSKRLTVVR